MVQVYLGIGSNINRQQNIALALTHLKRKFGALQISPVYESSPVDCLGSNYYNLAVGFQTDQSLKDLRSSLRELEDRLERDREAAGEVTIDLDLLIYGDLQATFDDCQLPHPDLQRHRHIVQPLVDIAGEATLPGQQFRIADLLDNPNLSGGKLRRVSSEE
jgi:2-amino-4-hydroxy-6-hydroxymethyldihydropteridine diphosphokinase